MLRGSHPKISCMVAAFSRRIKRVCRSTFAAELMNQANAYDLAMFTSAIFDEVFGYRCDVHMRTDCMSLVKMVHSLRSHPMEHRLNAEVDAIREGIIEEEIQTFEAIPNESPGLGPGPGPISKGRFSGLMCF